MDESQADERALLSAAAAPLLKAGYKVESDIPGTLVLVAGQIKIPVGLMLILTVVTVGFWIPLWLLLFCLPRVNRHTFAVVDGVVVDTKSWRAS
ncbi:hypothetical protein SAMN04489740_0845 [Arthrobacter alpinus]|uniref:Uncharacterized protein n=1 Tax=Arthrobacter alpinus TaxID=656366 RepID=A0A1H5GV75_9MICC|nr:hypothetical protein [Arthrobacter alpinus]SEE18958.1 hypothetical protein SAMN04489740_0845 [Arthrobacter alpinus]